MRDSHSTSPSCSTQPRLRGKRLLLTQKARCKRPRKRLERVHEYRLVLARGACACARSSCGCAVDLRNAPSAWSCLPLQMHALARLRALLVQMPHQPLGVIFKIEESCSGIGKHWFIATQSYCILFVGGWVACIVILYPFCVCVGGWYACLYSI